MSQAIQECARCDQPQGRIVIINNHEPVCGACITQVARIANVVTSIAIDRTPAVECGFVS